MNVSQQAKLSWDSLLSETYRLYWNKFWRLFRIGLPVALLTYLFTHVQHAFAHWLQRELTARRLVAFYDPWILGFVTGAVYWLISTIFLAAVAHSIVRGGDEDPGEISDSYSPVRKRLGPLLAVGLVTWVLFFIGQVIADWFSVSAVSHFKVRSGTTALTVIFSVPLLMVTGLVSRLALAIPTLVDDPEIRVTAAIRNSIKRSEGWEFFFMFFVAKSALVGYAVYWLVHRGLRQWGGHASVSASAYYWVTWAVYVCLFAVLESPLFIAISLLYRDSRSEQEDALHAPALG
jgi:hypothetical protein